MPLTDRELAIVDALIRFSREETQTNRSLFNLREEFERMNAQARSILATSNQDLDAMREWIELYNSQLEKIEIYLTNRDDVAALALSVDSLRDRAALEPKP